MANIQTEALGEQKNLTDKHVRAAVKRNPELSPEDRQKVPDNTRKIILASNRRADITGIMRDRRRKTLCGNSPFNAADSLTLLQEKGTGKATEPGPQGKGKA